MGEELADLNTESVNAAEVVLWPRLFDICRATLVERTIYGGISVYQNVIKGNGNQRSTIKTFRNVDPLIFGRSLLKPWQMKPIAKDLQSQLSWEEKALSVASHNGETIHTELLARLQTHVGHHNLLQVPASRPLGGIQCPSLTPTQLSHPCCGKHLAILKVCQARQWNPLTYLELDHPYNSLYLRELGCTLAKMDETFARDKLKFWNPLVARDGCGLPTVAIKLSALAFLFADLAAKAKDDWIWEAAHRNPNLVGGTGRLDTEIISRSPHLFAKEGADGLLGLAIKTENNAGKQFTGIVIKLASGYDMHMLWFLAHRILKQFGFAMLPPSSLPGQQICFNSDLDSFIKSGEKHV